jgi:hypothetical protein
MSNASSAGNGISIWRRWRLPSVASSMRPGHEAHAVHVRERPHRDGDEDEEDGEAEHRARPAAAEHGRPEDDREEAHHRPGEEDAKHEEEGFHGRQLSNGRRARARPTRRNPGFATRMG